VVVDFSKNYSFVVVYSILKTFSPIASHKYKDILE